MVSLRTTVQPISKAVARQAKAKFLSETQQQRKPRLLESRHGVKLVFYKPCLLKGIFQQVESEGCCKFTLNITRRFFLQRTVMRCSLREERKVHWSLAFPWTINKTIKLMGGEELAFMMTYKEIYQ